MRLGLLEYSLQIMLDNYFKNYNEDSNYHVRLGLNAYFWVGGAPLSARSFLLLVRVSNMKSKLDGDLKTGL